MKITPQKTLIIFLICISLISLTLGLKTIAQSTNHQAQNNMNTKKIINSQLLNSNQKFAFKLFNQLNNEENLLISPTSIAIALTLLYNGADGVTKQEMAQTLAIQGITLDEVNQGYRDLQQLLTNNNDIELSIANSLWIRKDFPIKQTFIDNNKKYFKAEVSTLEFKHPETTKTINSWVNNATKGKISEIIDSVKPDDVLFLINAIYFNSNWQKQFDSKLTTKQPFYLEKNKTIDYPLMSQRGNFSYYENKDFQLINLPYGKSGAMSMYILLPQKDVNLSTITTRLNEKNWQQWLSNLSNKEGLIALPKFTLEYKAELNDTLSNLGMKTAFNNADFSNLTAESIVVSEVKHKTFINVDEKGTEAAAVTSIGIRATSMPIDSPFQMIVNRPFLYVIQDNNTGTILFMGTINQLEISMIPKSN
ncbi:serpin family protein [Geminocystis herdmanii]|uniref:serpin family protein n=1 Tax=Geminocystis herdmanii TaxID=669359 RepID=UPI000346F1BB|nr:serpin family protein [Geminocystis herdmanii]